MLDRTGVNLNDFPGGNLSGQPRGKFTEFFQVDKEGVEFTFASRRFPVIRTRVTVNGAWFRTTLANSTGLWYKPDRKSVV